LGTKERMFAPSNPRNVAVLATGPGIDGMDAAELYRQHLAHIGQIAQSVCRRNGVNDHDAEDFASDVRLKLCDDDYGVIRKFQGKSSFTTYLTVVIMNKVQITSDRTPSSRSGVASPPSTSNTVFSV